MLCPVMDGIQCLDPVCALRGCVNQPSAEIEVTPAMVEAGFKVLSKSGIAEEYLGADELLVVDIYRAMESVRNG